MFKIEVDFSKKILNKNSEDTSVMEAIETIYDYGSNIVIFWNEYQIHFTAKATLSDIYNDIVFILKKIKTEEDFYINILSSSLTAKWEFNFKKDNLKVNTTWYTANITKEGNTIKNLKSVLEVKKQVFINEWNSLLSTVKKDLIKSGYNNSLKGFDYLENLHAVNE